MIYVFLTGKKEQDSYLKSLSRGIESKLILTKHFVRVQPERVGQPRRIVKNNLTGCSGVVFAGLLRGNAHILETAISKNINFYYVDHAYFNASYKYPNWMRIVKNGFSQNTILPVSDDRLFTNFNIKFQDYSFRDKKNIVVLPPSNTFARVFKATDWETKTIEALKKHTDRPIVVRKKNSPVMDDLMINVVGKEIYNYEDTIEEVLNDAYCVVTFNSSLALRALEKGIPVICDKYCPAFPLSHTIEEIENLKEKDRIPLFSSLAHGQYTLEEISNPATFKFINKAQQWRGTY